MSNDPIKLAGGNNLQVYAPNPTQWVDPLGLAGCTCTVATDGQSDWTLTLDRNTYPETFGHIDDTIQATGLAGALSSGNVMGMATQALGVASSYVPELGTVAQGLGVLQGIAGNSGVMPEPSNEGRIGMVSNSLKVGGGFGGSVNQATTGGFAGPLKG